jgi:hypothetical protein
MFVASFLDCWPSTNPHLCIYAESPPDPNDTQLGHYLIATWEKVCQVMGPEFEPYLSVVMPSLLATAGAKADLLPYRAFTPV